MHEKRFRGDAARLRSPERISRLSVDDVIARAVQGLVDRNPNKHEAESGSVLDIGTGSGLFAERFAALGFSVSGVDADPAMAALAKEHVPAGNFVSAVAESLPFDDDMFDLVFMGFVLHETDAPLDALTEAARTSHGGVAVLEWPYREEEFGPPLEHRLARDTVLDWFTQVGLEDGEMTAFDHVVLYTAKTRRS